MEIHGVEHDTPEASETCKDRGVGDGTQDGQGAASVVVGVEEGAAVSAAKIEEDLSEERKKGQRTSCALWRLA